MAKRKQKPLKAQGSGPTKRTPKGDFDGAAGNDIYVVEKILGEGSAKGTPVYLIRWQGYGKEDDTWEPIENLAGMEEHIAQFRAVQREKNDEACRQVRNSSFDAWSESSVH